MQSEIDVRELWGMDYRAYEINIEGGMNSAKALTKGLKTLSKEHLKAGETIYSIHLASYYGDDDSVSFVYTVVVA